MTCHTMPTAGLRFKRGDTFSLSGPITVLDAGQPVADLTGWQGASQVRDLRGALIATLAFEWIDATQRLCRLRATGPTNAWAIGPAEIDVQLTSPAGEVISTETARLEIVRDVTA